MTRKFKVKIENEVYEVEIEEITDSQKNQPETMIKKEKNSTPSTSASSIPTTISNSQISGNNTRDTVSSGEEKIIAPLPGTVVDIRVEAGEEVHKGDVVVMIETMKMENEITSPFSGIVREVLVKNGEAVASGQPLIVLY